MRNPLLLFCLFFSQFSHAAGPVVPCLAALLKQMFPAVILEHLPDSESAIPRTVAPESLPPKLLQFLWRGVGRGEMISFDSSDAIASPREIMMLHEFLPHFAATLELENGVSRYRTDDHTIVLRLLHRWETAIGAAKPEPADKFEKHLERQSKMLMTLVCAAGVGGLSAAYCYIHLGLDAYHTLIVSVPALIVAAIAESTRANVSTIISEGVTRANEKSRQDFFARVRARDRLSDTASVVYFGYLTQEFDVLHGIVEPSSESAPEKVTAWSVPRSVLPIRVRDPRWRLPHAAAAIAAIAIGLHHFRPELNAAWESISAADARAAGGDRTVSDSTRTLTAARLALGTEATQRYRWPAFVAWARRDSALSAAIAQEGIDLQTWESFEAFRTGRASSVGFANRWSRFYGEGADWSYRAMARVAARAMRTRMPRAMEAASDEDLSAWAQDLLRRDGSAEIVRQKWTVPLDEMANVTQSREIAEGIAYALQVRSRIAFQNSIDRWTAASPRFSAEYGKDPETGKAHRWFQMSLPFKGSNAEANWYLFKREIRDLVGELLTRETNDRLENLHGQEKLGQLIERVFGLQKDDFP